MCSRVVNVSVVSQGYKSTSSASVAVHVSVEGQGQGHEGASVCEMCDRAVCVWGCLEEMGRIVRKEICM